MKETSETYDWVLTGIGDSLTVGVGAPLLGKGYVRRYAGFLEDRFNKKIKINNFAVTGATSGEILDSLERKEVKQAIYKAKIILITAGGNDLIHAGVKYFLTLEEEPLYHALEVCKRNLRKIFKKIIHIKKNSRKSYIIRICSLYNPFKKLAQATKWVKRFNQHIRSFEKLPHVKVADLYEAFRGRERELLSFDNIHPNQKGYQVIAVALYDKGFKDM